MCWQQLLLGESTTQMRSTLLSTMLDMGMAFVFSQKHYLRKRWPYRKLHEEMMFDRRKAFAKKRERSDSVL